MPRRILKSLCFAILPIAGVFFAPSASSANLCQPRGYTIGFFNGVWNTAADASLSQEKLAELIGTSFNNQSISYETFYNHTGESVGANSLQDIAEVFQQRAAEIDASGELGKRWELFWENLSGDKTFIDKLLSLFPSASDVMSQLYTETLAKIVAGTSELISNPPTEADYQTHSARLDELAIQGQKLMLVGHSQGNLFMNHGYDHVIALTESVHAVYVAPASSTLRGAHVLADIDAVINALRALGNSAVPPVNLRLQASSIDRSGHAFVLTYLDHERQGRASIEGHISSALGQIPPAPAATYAGSFTISLSLNKPYGLQDLHVYEPDGSHVYYHQPTGKTGTLQASRPRKSGSPQRYDGACESGKVQAGTYRIAMNNYSQQTGQRAIIKVLTNDGTVIASGVYGAVTYPNGADGHDAPEPIMELLVKKNPDTGALSFAVKDTYNPE